MPYRITWEPHGVYREYFGDVTIAERQQSFDEICNDIRFDALRYSITNYLQVLNYEVSSVATEEIAALHIGPTLTNPHIRIAAVADRADILAAIANFKQTGFIATPYRVFATLGEARAWVGQA